MFIQGFTRGAFVTVPPGAWGKKSLVGALIKIHSPSPTINLSVSHAGDVVSQSGKEGVANAEVGVA